MKDLNVRSKLLLCFVFVNVLSIGTASFFIYSEMRPHFLEAVEYTLIDMTRVLSSQLAASARSSPKKEISTHLLEETTQLLSQTRFPERNLFDKANRSLLQIYVTDHLGRVIFDSLGRSVGNDFSKWRDVKLSLTGRYGARATRIDPQDPNTSTHFVSAPILVDGNIVGVISIGKSVESISGFLNNSKQRILSILIGAALAAIATGVLATQWISRPVLQLSPRHCRENS